MSLRAVEHIFNGETTPLVISNGTVAVSGTAVTGTGSFFTTSMVGMKIGFGSKKLPSITTWYLISAYTSSTSITLSTSAGTINAGSEYVITGYDSTKTSLGTLMIQKTGVNPEDNFVGPFPVSVARPMEESTPVSVMYPHAITYSPTIDWVFAIENNAAVAKRIFLYEYNKVTAKYNWKGFITANCGANATNVCRGFRAQRYLHTTGTVAVATPASFYATNTASLAVSGVVTGVTTTFTIGMVGKMIGFGSTNPALISTWYPIISFTSTTSITVSGASNIIAAGVYVIADCTVTGTSTQFVTEGIAAGTTVTGAAGGLGPRIGFGSTDPTQITQWYRIGAIASDTSLNLVSSPGIIAAGTPYVIEELRFAFALTNTTLPNGGLFLAKGVGITDFQTSSTAGPLVIPFIASAIDNQRGVYWLSDSGTAGNVVTNVASCGLTLQSEVNKGLHYAYVPDGVGSAYMKVYRYNLRATGTIASGKMTMSVAYYTTGTVGVSSTAVTGSGTTFTAAMVGMKIGFGSKSPALITTWYVISAYTSSTSITLSSSAGTIGAGTNYVIDAADVITTGNSLVAGTVVAVNNGRIGTLNHGPGAGVESLYFVTATRIYRAALSNIYSGNLDWISDNRPEIPPGSVNTFPLTNALNAVEIADQIDRLIVLTTGATAFRQYVTRYPEVAGDQFDHVWGVDDKQQDQILAGGNAYISSGTVAVSSTAVTGTNTFFTSAMVGFRIGFGSTDPTAISTWYTISAFTSITSITLSSTAGVIGGGSAYVIDWNSGTVPHFNTSSQVTSVWSQNGIAHIVKHGTTSALNQIYALPLGADWSYAETTNQRVITPIIYTPDCASFHRVAVTDIKRLGSGEFAITPEPYRIYYRTKGLHENTGAWTLVVKDGDLTGLSSAPRIQFMFEFATIGLFCVPARVISATVIYDDTLTTTDSHYQPSAGKSNPATKRFAWRFATAFGGTVPTLRVRIYNAVTGDLFMDDYSANAKGTWNKLTDGGTTWGAYNTSDKANETTYISYTPPSLGDNIKVRVVLTQ
jgi:hypothetical protein